MTFYKDGIISIPNVTGDVVITATAVAQAPIYTNLITTSIDTNGNIYNGTGYKDGYRLNSSGNETVQEKCIISGFISAVKGDTIRVKSANNLSAGIGNYVIEYDTNFSILSAHPLSASNVTGDIGKVVLNNNSCAYVRVSVYDADATKIARFCCTKNEEIPSHS